jgi:excisionase family DNA binding protein
MRIERQTYRPEEVARILRISLMSVYRRLEDGEIPSIRIGGLYRIPIELFHTRFPDLSRPPRSR